MEEGRKKNGTFAMHYDMMQHCTEVGEISFAERLGGKDGYTLMLAAVKSSLPSLYLNGACSYAAFTTRLLYEHFKCGHYYKRMKETLFTTPNKDSDVNFGLDTQREMDHKDAIKAFRSGSTMKSIVPRMSLLDSLNELHKMASKPSKSSNKRQSVQELLGMMITNTNMKYITRIVSGITTAEDANVYNVYDQRRPVISPTILDTNTEKIGHFLIKKFEVQPNMFGSTKAVIPELNKVEGPAELVQKLKTSKGVTIRRMSVKQKNIKQTEREKKEEKRHKLVKQEARRIDCLSSEMNACQAVVKPDCSKPKVAEFSGIKNALIQTLDETVTRDSNAGDILEDKKLVYLSKKTIPADVVHSVSMATIEFAGVKFKTHDHENEDSILRQLAICEEKYHLTPYDFKAATSTQRQKKQQFTITHLKTAEEILTIEKFDKISIVTTSEGKNLISRYLARKVEKLNIRSCLIVDIDSEYKMSDCQCNDTPCGCVIFTNPIRSFFPKLDHLHTEVLFNIRKTKGEAEMVQIDWLMEYSSCLQQDESCASIVTSGDIDAVVLHMFAMAYRWPRLEEKSFKNDVFVIIQKPGNNTGNTINNYNYNDSPTKKYSEK
ncbi:hypothetical protein MAR_019179 [Mya arenaria]|uniref:Uncharacterized protein n=1 Tax=Mya arenaria TaxID=6604 RepID=A0ABY7EPX1_MYAAR|nr:hypothetical protein MAR_019179 [Mya arenaria]